MQENETFVVFGLQPWDLPIGSNCKNIALELAKKHRVIYVNNPLDFGTLLKKKNDVLVQNRLAVIKGKTKQLEQISDSLWVYTPNFMVLSTNFLPKGWIFDAVNLYNNKKIAQGIKRVLSQLSLKKFYFFNDSEMFKGFYLKELLNPQAYLYYSRDNLMAVPFWQKHGLKAEALLVAKSDYAFANSMYLQAQLKKHNSKSYYIGQGCDLDAFDATKNHPLPSDLPSDKPVICYVGAIYSLRLDEKLLLAIAKLLPEYNLVLVGPEDTTFKQSALHQQSNVYFLGSKKESELASYIFHAQVCINPQLINEVTMGNYPRKIDEYLALGKAVVATNTETMSVFSDYVYLANSIEEYISHIKTAMHEEKPDKKAERIAYAHTHTWENSVNMLLSVIKNEGDA